MTQQRKRIHAWHTCLVHSKRLLTIPTSICDEEMTRGVLERTQRMQELVTMPLIDSIMLAHTELAQPIACLVTSMLLPRSTCCSVHLHARHGVTVCF